MTRRCRREDDGQIAIALLMLMVLLVFLGFVFTQVGSAADQKTQTQTAADSAAVAVGHQLRDRGVAAARSLFVVQFPKLGAVLVGLPEPTGTPSPIACAAAQANWDRAIHDRALSCNDVMVSQNADTVAVHVTAPQGQVADGPADTADARAEALATATIVLRRCPSAATPEEAAVAHWLADAARKRLFASGPVCSTPADAELLVQLETGPAPGTPVIPDPAALLVHVSEGFRVQLTA